MSYPDECIFTPAQESEFLKEKTESKNEIEIVAEINGKIVGTAGIDAVGGKFKISHRADFGIAILKEYCGLGIGSALTNACIECARAAGFSQLELNVVAENKAAVSLYKKLRAAKKRIAAFVNTAEIRWAFAHGYRVCRSLF